MISYQIANWKVFENNKSRERDRCSFVCLPNKQDGLGLAHILAESDGAALIGIWTLIVQACSRHQRPRAGWLTVDGQQAGTPWAPEDLALRWRRPVAEIKRALEVASRPKVGWLIVHGVAEVPAAGQQTDIECPGREGKGSEEKGREAKVPSPSRDPKDDLTPREREDFEQLRAQLKLLLLDSRDEPVTEWVILSRNAGCKSAREACKFLEWAVTRLKREMNVRYARDAINMADAWKNWGRAQSFKAEEGAA